MDDYTSYQPPFASYGGGRRAGRAKPSVGVVGLAVTLLGAVLLVLAFTALDWFSIDGQSASFRVLHNAASSVGGEGSDNRLAVQYFSWLAWVLAAVIVISAVAANIPNPASVIFRTCGLVLGLGAMAITFASIKLDHDYSYGQFLKHASAGFYIALTGFLITAIGATLASVRVN